MNAFNACFQIHSIFNVNAAIVEITHRNHHLLMFWATAPQLDRVRATPDWILTWPVGPAHHRGCAEGEGNRLLALSLYWFTCTKKRGQSINSESCPT